MATSGNFRTPDTGGIGSQYPKYALFEWWQNGQSIDGNYTDIGWKFTVQGGSHPQNNIGVYSGSVTVNGETTNFNFGGARKRNGDVLASGSKRIWHNDDGSKSFSTSGTCNFYWSSGHAVSGSGSWWLNTIARKVNISNVTGSCTDDDFSPTVSWKNNGNRVDLKLELPDYGVNPFKLWTNVQGSSSFKPTLTASEMDGLRQRMANTNTTRMRFTVLTMIGGKEKFYDFIDKTFTIVNANPTLSDKFFPYDSRKQTQDITGDISYIIQNESNLVVEAYQFFKPKKFATIKTIVAKCSGKEVAMPAYTTDYKVFDLGRINASTDQTLSMTVTDSRGNVSTATKNIPVLPYSAPVINLSVARKNNFENETTVKIGGSYTTISGKNTINATTGVQYRYKDASTTNWTAWTSKTATFSNGDFTVAPFVLSLDNSKSYNFEAKVTDRLKTTTVAGTLNRGIPIFRISTVDSKCYNNEKRMLVVGDSMNDLKTVDESQTTTNQPPSWYKAKGVRVMIEKKNQTALGVGEFYGQWCLLTTYFDGDTPFQIVTAGGSWHDGNLLYIRYAYNKQGQLVWGTWRDLVDSTYTCGISNQVIKNYGNIYTTTKLTMPQSGFLCGKGVVLKNGSKGNIEIDGIPMGGVPYYNGTQGSPNIQSAFCIPVTKDLVVDVMATGKGQGQVEMMKLVRSVWKRENWA